ncbi:MAG TPA: LysR family transcriptional regulator [Verrucomicrobiales bacterium]|nr:LysR family transcriptional regulator [Verrucomicrobiales bacterium]
MNLHHLELFYYVARHGGIMGAVRNIPYGIQQPAVSSQIAQLELDLGQRLFVRRPFSLTPAGIQLYEFIRPFFLGMDPVAERVRGGGAVARLRFAGPTLVLRNHLPALFNRLRRKFPKLRLLLRDAVQTQVEHGLLQQEIDVGITLLEESIAPGIKSAPLLDLPVVLLVGKQHEEKTFAALLKRDLLDQTLIAFPSGELLHRRFREHLASRDLEWPVGIELNSLDLIEEYVAQGFGVGLSVKVPGESRRAGVREIPIPEIPPLRVGILWRTPLGEVAEALIDIAKERARSLTATS